VGWEEATSWVFHDVGGDDVAHTAIAGVVPLRCWRCARAPATRLRRYVQLAMREAGRAQYSYSATKRWSAPTGLVCSAFACVAAPCETDLDLQTDLPAGSFNLLV
jgi:hypothetical protein